MLPPKIWNGHDCFNINQDKKEKGLCNGKNVATLQQKDYLIAQSIATMNKKLENE